MRDQKQIGWFSLYTLIVALALIAVVGAFSAKAEGLKPSASPAAQFAPDAPVAVRTWTGFYVGVNAGYGMTTTEISAGGGSIDGISAHGVVYGVSAGVDYQFPRSALVARARASYDWSNVEFAINPIFKAGFKEGWSGDAGLGYAMGTAMPYILVGYTEMKTEASIGGTALPSPDLAGKRVTGGIEWRLPSTGNALFQPTLALEATYTAFDSKTYGPVTFEPDDLTVKARINFGFKGLGDTARVAP